MSDKKHIDRLFQEKLKDFEATPNDAVWNNINSQLKKDKDDRKVIPIWWKLAGVAAALILLLTVGNLIINDSKSTTNVVDTEKVDANNIKIDKKNNSIAAGDKENLEERIDESSDESTLNDTDILQSEISSKNESLVNSDESETKKNPIKSKSNQTNYQNKNANQTNNYLVNTDKKDVAQPNKSSEQPSNVINNTIKNSSLNQYKNKEALVESKTTKSNIIKENTSEDIINNKEEQLVINEITEKTPSNKDIISNNSDRIEKEEQLIVEKEKIPLTEDVIVSNENSIEEEKEAINRWQINPNIAPVYFNSFGKGSTIHEQLVNNEKIGEINMSYGVNVSYEVNNKLSVKSGVNRVNLGYTTNDIIIYDNLNGIVANTDLFRNIDLGESMPQSSFLSGSNLSLTQSHSIIPIESSALIKQEMTYYEIPMEVEYKLSDKKLGLSLVGGFSTFILSDNNVSYELKGVNTELGEAANLNNTSFSANFGFGLDYNVSKNINLNIDPMFKYQINTFNNTSGDFQPYFIGVYSGINIKF